MKVLIIRFSSIGDIVFTSPIIRCIKEQLPEIEIHFCTKPAFKHVIENNPNISAIHYLDASLRSLIQTLRQENFDLIIDLHNNLRSTLLKIFIGKAAVTYRKFPLKYFLLTKFKWNLLPKNHVIDRYFETINHLGLVNDGKGIDFFISSENEIRSEKLPEFCRTGYVAIIIGASRNTKKLPFHKTIELCKKINSPIVLIGGREDAVLGMQLENHFFINPENNISIYNACGKYNVGQSASLVKQASHVFGHDTGLTHIAAAFHQRIYSIWGNTVPDFGMYPYIKENIFIENNNLACRPCSKLGSAKCPLGHFKCMNELVFDFKLVP